MIIPNKKAGDFELPAIGFGTWRVGGVYEPNTSNDEKEIAAIKAALEMGITHIDTAELYGAGHAEELIRLAIKAVDRKKLFITSKVMPQHLRYDGLIASCRASLKRLGIKQLDLYLIHAPNPDIPLKETMKALDFLVEEGLVFHIGVSNFSKELIEQAQSHAKHRIVNNQIHYSLSAREFDEEGTLEYCEKHQILVTAYRPLGLGLFGGVDIGADILKQLSQKYQKTPAQIAINWVINKPNVVALIKASNPEHLREDLGALGWRLEIEDELRLDHEFPQGTMVYGPRR
ncbi:MAG: aldo/keto reductase [Candidatus Doudnabacteria bacterium]|nr:aldo/keto reductase [Candidatus Doudnabacteria bacterium]